MTPEEIARFIQSHRLPLSHERGTQVALADVFAHSGIPFQREVRLGAADIIDFVLCETIGLEIKLKGQRRRIYRQCERYCMHDRLTALILATNVAMAMPAAINGRPIVIASLGKAWL